VRFRSRPRVLAVAVAASVLSGGTLAWLAGSSACTTTITYNAALVSGIFINTATLLNDDTIGCGASDSGGELYKYVAVVINDNHDIGGAGIFDCYADGVFGNLPGTDAGSLDFAVWIYGYNARDFAAANSANGQNDVLVNAVNTLNGVYQPDGSVIPVSASAVPANGKVKGAFPDALKTVCTSKATWVSTCSAASQAGVQVLANCTPLSIENATPTSCTLPVKIPDGGHG